MIIWGYLKKITRRFFKQPGKVYYKKIYVFTLFHS